MLKQTHRSLLFLLLGLMLAGCAASDSVTPTFLNPKSIVASDQATLYEIIFFMALGVFLLVELWLLYNVVRFRSRGQEQEPPRQKYGNWRLEFVWTAIPVLLVLILFILSVRTINATAAPKSQPTDLNVNVIGHQWWWEFDYPDLGIKTANELHVPVGAVVHITLNSVDVIHSFWVPQLSGKLDVIPGQTNHLWFKAARAGTYHGQCAEFCGLNHANMRFLVMADPPDQFQAWAANQQQPESQPAGDQAQKGYATVTKGLCSNCHTLGANTAVNPIGPNLTHLMSRTTFAGGIYPLTPENLRSWLTDNQAMKPGNDMKVTLSPQDVDNVLAYLLTLK